ncbi:MAG TPA: 6-phosphofructokinase [Candidatus Scatomorpha merdipullorum]|uniref:Pyrophosphate--fructose 6-phosphate 1-phosphotransferase n=1 Tax=Candidatus Scatomorpha merdipullorum TaxID=2840927 RepID=A0A9D1FEE7_9FIRM|nr:6-phosphofructokinase [Candidatus Scatomorpha merdipullorum]
MLKGNMLIAQGGGPTPVINSSLLGAVREAKRHPEAIETIYGARYGAEGILAGDLIDLGAVPTEQLDLLARTPASAIGSCRRKLTDADYPAVLECFKKFNIRYFFYNGGNDSMDTCNKVYNLAVESGYELHVIGIPKTIDNDLAVTDHCPGFGSAAKYAAASALELAQDAAALPIHVVVMEMMGRNAGWITAASALFTKLMPCEHLVYLPETDFNKDEFLAAVKEKWAKGRGLLVTVSEGIHYAGGAPVADSGIVDGFGHKVPGGAAQTLSDMIMNELGLKSRSEKPGLLGRTSVALMSEVDRDEAELAGATAVRAAVEGETGYMVGFRTEREPEYKSETILVPLAEVANAEKTFPLEWITPGGVTDEFRSYCLPLIGEYDTRFVNLR